MSYSGQTGPFGLDEYTLPLLAGQALTVSVTSPHQDAFLSVFGLDQGGSLVRTQDEQISWQGTISETQTYAVNVFAIGTETEYNLEIEAGPPPAEPTPTPAAVPTGRGRLPASVQGARPRP